MRDHFDNEDIYLRAAVDRWLDKAQLNLLPEDAFFVADTLYLTLDVEIPRYLLSKLAEQPGFVRISPAADHYPYRGSFQLSIKRSELTVPFGFRVYPIQNELQIPRDRTEPSVEIRS